MSTGSVRRCTLWIHICAYLFNILLYNIIGNIILCLRLCVCMRMYVSVFVCPRELHALSTVHVRINMFSTILCILIHQLLQILITRYKITVHLLYYINF